MSASLSGELPKALVPVTLLCLKERFVDISDTSWLGF